MSASDAPRRRRFRSAYGIIDATSLPAARDDAWHYETDAQPPRQMYQHARAQGLAKERDWLPGRTKSLLPECGVAPLCGRKRLIDIALMGIALEARERIVERGTVELVTPVAP